MNCIKSKDLLKEELVPEETVLLHGTSVEATIDFLKTGVFNFARRTRPYKYEGYLFFAPNGAFFEDNPLGIDPILCNWKYANELVSQYAQMIAWDHSTLSRLGFIPENIGEFDHPERKDLIDAFLVPEMEKKGYSKNFVYNLGKELSQRKGVIIGINKEIFKLGIEPGKDEPEQEVCLYLPEGLDSGYINGIKPLGELERKIIENHLISVDPNAFSLGNQTPKYI